MLKEDLIKRNPLRILCPELNKIQAENRMGLVVARAGLGKTAILVQIALESMLRNRKVLHVSVGESLEKTKAWYDDIFNSMFLGISPDKVIASGGELMRNRMIMTFKEATFSRPKLEERLNDLVYQDIFRPECIVVDGFNFAETDRETVTDIKEMAKTMNLEIWFSALSHRDDTRVSASGVPAPCHELDDLFETVVNLLPEGNSVLLHIIKDDTGCVAPGVSLALDPSTMMVRGG